MAFLAAIGIVSIVSIVPMPSASSWFSIQLWGRIKTGRPALSSSASLGPGRGGSDSSRASRAVVSGPPPPGGRPRAGRELLCNRWRWKCGGWGAAEQTAPWRPARERRGPQQLDLQRKAEVTPCPERRGNVGAVVKPPLSRRARTVLEVVQHSSALLTRVHIATGAPRPPDLAPPHADDLQQCFGVLQLSPWIKKPPPGVIFSFGSGAFGITVSSHFSVRISSRTALGYS